MREIRSYGSVRGVAGNRYPYRDSLFRTCRWRAKRRKVPETVGVLILRALGLSRVRFAK